LKNLLGGLWMNSTRKLVTVTGLAWLFDAMDVGMLSFVIDADRFIPLQEIRNVAFKNTEKL
jgi:hypothetical protein